VPGDIESIPFSATLDDMHINIVVTETTMTMYINGKNPMKSYNVAPWSNGSLLLDVAGGDVQTFADWGGTSLNLTVVSAASAAGSYTSPPWYYKSFMILDEGEY